MLVVSSSQGCVITLSNFKERFELVGSVIKKMLFSY